MGWYGVLSRKGTPEDFPDIDAERLTDEVNKLFKPYLFFKNQKNGRQLWSSCCNKSGFKELGPVMDNTDMVLLYGEHNDEAVCPWCGRTVQLKNASRLGQRKYLLEYHPVIFLSERGGEIFARAYWARKDYQGALDALPLFMLTFAYHFKPGMAIQWCDYYGKWEQSVITPEKYSLKDRKISEPFKEYQKYVSYNVFGWEAIENSSFYQYCQYDAFSHTAPEALHFELMKFLAAYSVYPKNVEMLIKLGKRRYVDELVSGVRKNAGAIRWGEDDPKKAFGLNGQELREYIRLDNDEPELLTAYKKLRRAGMPMSFQALDELFKQLPGRGMESIKLCCKRGVRPDKLLGYLEKSTGPRRYGGYFGVYEAFQMWKDYTEMAEALGWELGEESVLLPRELELRHNEAAEERQLQLEAVKKKERDERRREAEESLARRRKRYNFAFGGYFIRLAETEDEILFEGKTLQHCVGGYAQRHLADQTSILFMRPVSAPDMPFVTVEMQGNRLIQAHGYRNERGDTGFEKPPRELFREFFDAWLGWVKAGSPRDKEGEPRRRRKDKTEAA